VSALLDVSGLDAGYDDAAVVRGLDLHVDPAEIVVLLGPNGAGKTTTLLTVSGLLAPSAGEIRILGNRTSGWAPHRISRLGVAHVAEERSLFQTMTVAENLRLGQRSRHRDLDDVLDLFPPLRGLLRRRAGLLSGGEQQMLVLARALLSRPALLMVDELSLGLAPLIVTDLMALLVRIARERETGVLLVEQHVDLALGVADRAYVLSRGRVAAAGPARDLAQRTELLEQSYLGLSTS
jgi:branched-chain amino acid transport system ATP-binding protein